MRLKNFAKSHRTGTVIKTLILCLYCTLICAAILLSFKSVYNSIASLGSGSNNPDLLELSELSDLSELSEISELSE